MTDATMMDIAADPAIETMCPGAPGTPVAPEELLPAPLEREETSVSSAEEGAEPAASVDGWDQQLDIADIPTSAQPGEAAPSIPDLPPDAVVDGVPDAVVDTIPDAAMGAVQNVEIEAAPAALVETLLDIAAPRPNKRRRLEAAPRPRAVPPLSAATDAARGDDKADGPDVIVAAESVPVRLPADDLDEPAWRQHWPDNEVRIVGRLLPRASDAPALDGVQRTRMELALVEHVGDAFGTMGNLPVFVMPGAPGFTAIYNEIQRARKQKRRLDPIMVELQGVLRQMPDRDTRYANERYAVLMGIEVHKITRVAADAEQFAYWRGRAQVVASRRYEHKGMPYQRVTAVVALKQRKPRLRGTSLTHIPVEFLVAPEHEHADRFRHVGQHLLIEANIGADVHRMSDHHPALEGIDDPRRKSQLQVLRESVVTVTLGEFPDEHAERAYHTWVKAGRPRPQREGRPARVSAPPGPAPEPSSDAVSVRANGHGRMQEEYPQADRGNGRGRQAPQSGSGNGNGVLAQVARRESGQSHTGS